MKKHLGIVLVAAIIVSVLLLYLVTFTVNYQESALLLRFGEIQKSVTEPGLKFKWPTPINQVVKFDTRVRTLAMANYQTQTRDKQNVIVSVYVNWRISDPVAFYSKYRSGNTDIIYNAEEKLQEIWKDRTYNLFAEYNFGELITLNTEKFKLIELERGSDSMLSRVRKAMSEDNYGVEIVDVGISRLGVPDNVTESVFERMVADRQAVVTELMSQGEKYARTMMGDAESQATIITATAEAQAKSIRGEGDALAAEYYSTFLKNPELANFLRRLETLRKTLNERTTIILDKSNPPYQLLIEGPEIKAGK